MSIEQEKKVSRLRKLFLIISSPGYVETTIIVLLIYISILSIAGNLVFSPLFLQFCFAAALFATGIPLLNRHLDVKIRLGDFLWILLVVIIALLLRILVAPHTIAHTNSHAYNYVRQIIEYSPFNYVGKYGHGCFAFFHTFLSLFGRTEKTVFIVNSIIGTLSVIPLYFISTEISRSKIAGILSALFLAILPVHVKYSATESMFILAVFGQLITLLSFLFFVRSGKYRFFFAGLLFLSFTMQTRPIMMFFPICVLLLGICFTRNFRAIFKFYKSILNTLLFILLSISPMLLAYNEYRLQSGSVKQGVYLEEAPNLILKTLGITNSAGGEYGFSSNPFFDPCFTPLIIIAFFIIGVVILIRKNRKLLLFSIVPALMFAFLYSPINTRTINDVRFQLAYQHFYILIAGAGGAWLVESIKIKYKQKAMLWFVVVALIAASWFPAYKIVKYKHSPQMEYDFLSGNIPLIDRNLFIIQMDKHIGNICTEMPYYLSEFNNKNHIWVEYSDFISAPRKYFDSRKVLFYRGISCYTFPYEPEDEEQPQCRYIMENFNAIPVMTRDIPAVKDFSFSYGKDILTIGFYELKQDSER
ncbi:MAG TPA: glycosyltransferase family 39 protein [bacterium]|nr:glycosyltransferase family 39 protein [bacterium]